MKKKLNIYLADLTYDTIILVSDTIPINIGFVASYLLKNFDNINIELFKYPGELFDKIKKIPPDVLGLSNYSWNSNLSEHFAGIAKRYNSDCVTFQGGTNFPHDDIHQLEFLKKRPNTDVYAIFEGERSSKNLIERILNSKTKNEIFSKPIDGCVFIKPEKNKDQLRLIKGKFLDRIKDLDEIPSPYLNGLLDKFFDGKLTPFIETNRGCPFKCSFCHTGSDYYHKLNKFSSQRVKDEIDYIGIKCSKLGITNLHMADVNFGMYPQDQMVCEFLLEAKKKYNWPLQIMATTGKNSKERVMKITSILGNMFSVNMSLQSMSDTVLENINRSNIKHSHMIEVNNKLRADGRSTKAELIIPLPGETKESFISGLNTVLESNASSVTIYTLMMLYGTEFKNLDYRKKFGYKGKYRIVPLNFGEYGGERIFDCEEVGIATKNLSYEDYLYIRTLALFVETLHNGKPFEEFFRYAMIYNLKQGDFLKYLIDNLKYAPKEVTDIVNNFIKETKNELWESEGDLINHYKQDKNYIYLKDGKVGGNLIYKYKARGLLESKKWCEFIAEQLYNYLVQNFKDINNNKIKLEISNIKNFCLLKLNGIFDFDADLSEKKDLFDYDILNWIDDIYKDGLHKYKVDNKLEIIFGYSVDQVKNREDYFYRYGKDINAISKIVTRISNLEGQFRLVRTKDKMHLREIYNKVGENFVRYALSN